MADIALENGMELRQGLTVAMQQNLNILQAPTLELRQIISHTLEINPVLETNSDFEALEISDVSAPEERREDGWDEYLADSVEHGDGARHGYLMDSLVESVSLASHLRQQLYTYGLDGKVKDVIDFLIGSLDRRGFLEDPVKELAGTSGFSEKEIRQGLEILRSFDPAGVGASGLKESLMFQLETCGEGGTVAFRVVKDCLEDLARRRYEVIAEKLSVDLEQVEEAARRIALLSPDPGASFDGVENRTVTPDVEVFENGEGGLDVRLTRGNLPVLSLNDEYKQILAESPPRSEVRTYLKKSFQEARQLISAIEMRQETLLKLVQFLALRQAEFFHYGSEYLKPLGMSEAAEVLEVHQTTISRAVSGKYLLCEFGLFELRYFFSSGYRNDSGEQMSSHAVKEVISRLVEREDPGAPLSDNDIADRLKEEGLNVARRTVAKYREQLKILPASLRKKR